MRERERNKQIYLRGIDGTTAVITSGSSRLLKLSELANASSEKCCIIIVTIGSSSSSIETPDHLVVLIMIMIIIRMMIPWKEMVMEVMVSASPSGPTNEIHPHVLVVVVMMSGRDEASVSQVLILGELGFSAAEIHLELAEPVLEKGYDSHAAVDRVPQTHLGLVGERIHCVLSLRRLQFVE